MPSPGYLAREGYASRGVDIPACAVDAPHIRQRLYWVASDMADADNAKRWSDGAGGDIDDGRQAGRLQGAGDIAVGSQSFWSDHVWLTGSDGKARRSKPGLPLLVNGIPNRVGKLRAYGNAIVPQVAAEVIKAFMETQS